MAGLGNFSNLFRGGFGTLILSGFQNNFWHAEIFTATLCCVLLAVVFAIVVLSLLTNATMNQKINLVNEKVRVMSLA